MLASAREDELKSRKRRKWGSEKDGDLGQTLTTFDIRNIMSSVVFKSTCVEVGVVLGGSWDLETPEMPGITPPEDDSRIHSDSGGVCGGGEFSFPTAWSLPRTAVFQPWGSSVERLSFVGTCSVHVIVSLHCDVPSFDHHMPKFGVAHTYMIYFRCHPGTVPKPPR